MKLPDFLEFEPFNALRARMGTDKLGYFEVFDPTQHLTGEERADLRTHGLDITRAQVHYLGDHTLAYKNSRIGLLYDGMLHVTRCPLLDDFRSGRVVSSDSAIALPSVAEAPSKTPEANAVVACQHCLHRLRFAGIDLDKERKLHHNERIIKQFTLAHFFTVYPDYPLFERTHVRHPF